MAELANNRSPDATNFFSSGRYTEITKHKGGYSMDSHPLMIICISFIVEFLLIVGTNSLCGHKAALTRATMAAGGCAAYAVGCLTSGLQFLGQAHWQLVFSLFTCYLAFGLEAGALRRSFVLSLLRLALSVISVGFDIGGFWTIVMVTLGICLICIWGIDGRVGRHYMTVNITHGGRMVELTALVNTGNALRDPVTGLPVLVVGPDTAWKLLSLNPSQLCRPVETLATGSCCGLRLIPYRAVGQERGLLLGLRVEQLLVDGQKQEMIVAFSPQPIGNGGKFQALAGGHLA
jgi:stage II sporulation protein GA (sporulation sigma-E factor processing peptidase)